MTAKPDDSTLGRWEPRLETAAYVSVIVTCLVILGDRILAGKATPARPGISVGRSSAVALAVPPRTL